MAQLRCSHGLRNSIAYLIHVSYSGIINNEPKSEYTIQSNPVRFSMIVHCFVQNNRNHYVLQISLQHLELMNQY